MGPLPVLIVALAHAVATPMETVQQRSGASSAQAGRCWVALGRKSYYGSTEQLRQLQQMVRALPPATCPRLGLGFSTPERTAVVAYDRSSGIIIRIAQWAGEDEVGSERWGGATDASILGDDPDDGFDQGAYQFNHVRPDQVPAALRAFTRQYGGRVGGLVP